MFWSALQIWLKLIRQVTEFQQKMSLDLRSVFEIPLQSILLHHIFTGEGLLKFYTQHSTLFSPFAENPLKAGPILETLQNYTDWLTPL